MRGVPSVWGAASRGYHDPEPAKGIRAVTVGSLLVVFFFLFIVVIEVVIVVVEVFVIVEFLLLFLEVVVEIVLKVIVVLEVVVILFVVIIVILLVFIGGEDGRKGRDACGKWEIQCGGMRGRIADSMKPVPAEHAEFLVVPRDSIGRIPKNPPVPLPMSPKGFAKGQTGLLMHG